MDAPSVLYIEDDAEQRDAVSSALAALGCQVTTAASGKEGLQLVGDGGFDAVLCDLNMPETDGFQVLDAVHRLKPDLPVIIVTAHGSIELGVEAIKRGAYNFVTKPLRADQTQLLLLQAADHRQTQRRLRRSEALLEMLLETVPDIIYSLDPDGAFLSISPSAKNVLGYEPRAMLGRSVFDLVHPDDLDEVRRRMTESIAARDDQIRTVEFRMLRADGEPRDFEIKRRLIYDDGGQVIRNDGIARDITDRGRAAAELQAILDAARNAILMAQPDGTITAVNRGLEELFNVPGGWAMGRSIDELFHRVEQCATDPSMFRRTVERLQASPDERTGELANHHELYNRVFTVERPALRHIAPFSVPVAGPADRVLGRVWLFADITRLKEADEQLHKVVQASPVPLIITRVEDGRILFANERLSELIGVPLDELIGLSSADFYADAADRQRVLTKLKQDGTLKGHEVRLRRRGGDTFWSLFSLVLTELNGESVVLGGVYDIDARKKIEQELRWERNFVSAILETAGALVVVLDGKGQIVRYNAACQQTTGYSFDEVKGRPFWEIFLVPEEAEQVKKVFASLTAGNFPSRHENHWLTRDGDRRFISWSNTALTAPDGTVEYVIATGIDITEQREAEEKLRLYREIFMNTSDAITIISAEGKIVMRNPAHEHFTGYPDEEIIGKEPRAFMGPNNQRRLFESLEREGRFRGELGFTSWRGEPIYVDLSAFPVESGTGELVCYAGMGREITERRRAEEVIATRLRYEEALAACSQTLLTTSGRNDPLDTVLGHLRRASRAGRVYVFFNKETDEGLCCVQTHEVCAEGVAPQLDNPLLQCFPYRNGFSRWPGLLRRGEAIHGPVGDLPPDEHDLLEAQGVRSILVLPIGVGAEWRGFIGFDEVDDAGREWSDNDVRALRTAAEMIGVYLRRKEVEEALRLSEERFRGLVENANDVIYALSPDGRYTYISPRFSEITGYAVADYLGRRADFIHPEDRQREEAWIKEAVARGTGKQGFQYRFRHADGSWRWAVSNASVLHDESGEVTRIIGVAHDITGIKRVEQDLARANQELKQKQSQLVQSEKMASLGMLVAGIAHEINTPIGAVNSVHNTLVRSAEKLRAALAEEAPELLERSRKIKAALRAIDEANQVIHSGTDRVTTIVRRLKSFARLDEAELKRVDIHEGIEDTLTIIHHELKHKVEVERGFGELPPLACYPSQLNQVFLNLFINANQAIADRGRIRVSTALEEGMAAIRIEDNGSGMPPEVMEHIFDPGFTTKGVGVGTGLGLAICYQIVQDHHGEIRVESRPDRGTTFTVLLPLDLDRILGVSL